MQDSSKMLLIIGLSSDMGKLDVIMSESEVSFISMYCLIALGIMHQVRYPLYYIKKLNLKLNQEQEEKIYKKIKITVDKPLFLLYDKENVFQKTFSETNFLESFGK